MTTELTIPLLNGSTASVSVEPGAPIYVVGRNGAGKSSLLQHFHRHHPQSRWLAAHRVNTLTSSSLNMTPLNRDQFDNWALPWGQNTAARYSDRDPGSRNTAAMYDLVQTGTKRSNRITSAVDAGAPDIAATLAHSIPDPIHIMSQILSQAGMEVSVTFDGHSFVANKPSGASYPVEQMSDGERSTFLLCCQVLAAPPNSLLLLDEPERHLHRAISVNLIASITAARNDCSYIIATNDLGLASASYDSQAIIVRECGSFETGFPSGWRVDTLKPPFTIDEQTRLEVLGSRECVLFVEGEAASLDVRLYDALFPSVSVVPKGSRHVVESAVKSLRGVPDLHQIHAYGIVDGDGDGHSASSNLVDDIVHLPVDSVESLLLDERLQRLALLRRQQYVASAPQDIEATLSLARTTAIAEITGHFDLHCKRFASRNIERQWRKAGTDWARLPDWSAPHSISLPLDDELKGAQTELSDLIANSDLAGFVRRWPVKRSSVPTAIAQALSFHSADEYYNVLLGLVQQDENARRLVIDMLGMLPPELAG